MSATLPVIVFLFGLLAPLDDAGAAKCTYQEWVWGDGPYKLCFYDCAGKREVKAVNSSETCPETIDR